MKNTHQNKNKHVPVLLEEVLTYLAVKPDESYLDLTAGYGGHAQAVLDKTKKPSRVTLVDRDNEATKHLSERFANLGVEVINGDYLSTSKKLLEQGRKFNIIFADLGVSSPHLNQASRGFSLKSDGPLDMRMDQQQALKASDIVNHYSEKQLSHILKDYGEERRADKIASLIVKSRPIQGTKQLADLIKSISPGYHRVHPATKTFQAIRIAVNGELDQLQQALPVWIDLLEPGGRLGVISFHSLEDRITKEFFRELSGNRYDSVLTLITKHPVTPGRDEIVTNPRARSAKLRVVVNKNKKGGVNAYPGKKSLPGL